jgi:predicted nucleotide-binding protein
MGRPTGSKNRNYPPISLTEALAVATAIEDQASGMNVSRLTLAELLDVSPSSSAFRDLVAASRFYGLTTGGINAEEFGLTPLGMAVTGGDEIARAGALKSAVLEVAPYRAFFEAFVNKKIPGAAALREFLTRSAGVPVERLEECIAFMLGDAEAAGLIRVVKGVQYVDLSGTPRLVESRLNDDGTPPIEVQERGGDEPKATVLPRAAPAGESGPAASPAARAEEDLPKKVFIAHGKNRTPLDQLKKALDQFKVSYAIAVDEPNKGRPISKKVATLMRDQCSSGIFIFTADERFQRTVDGKTEEVWRPSENVVFELGAASILYENRIVIFKEKGVSFPSDFSDLGYIEFEKDELVAELGNLFSELVALDILEVRAKG